MSWQCKSVRLPSAPVGRRACLVAPWRSSLPTVTGAPGSVRGLLKATHTGHLGIRAHPTHARCCRRGIAVTSIRLWVALLQPRRGPTQALRARCALQLPGDQPPLLEFLALLRLSHQKARAATRAIHFCDRATTRKTKSCATGQRVRQGTAPSGHAQDKPWMGRRASPSPNKMPGFLGLPLRVFAQEVGEQRCANT